MVDIRSAIIILWTFLTGHYKNLQIKRTTHTQFNLHTNRMIRLNVQWTECVCAPGIRSALYARRFDSQLWMSPKDPLKISRTSLPNRKNRLKRQDAAVEDELAPNDRLTVCLTWCETHTAVSRCCLSFVVVSIRRLPWFGRLRIWPTWCKALSAGLTWRVTSEAQFSLSTMQSGSFLRAPIANCPHGPSELGVLFNLSHKRPSFYLITVCASKLFFFLFFHLKKYSKKRRCTDRDSLR